MTFGLPSRGIVSETIHDCASPDRACQRFLDELGLWIHACIRKYGNARVTDVHDQGTYTTAWEPWVAAGDSGPARGFLTTARDRIAGHFQKTGQWRHGYWRMNDVHHGTEHFELFLGALHRVDPTDGATGEHLVHAVEHLGNWSADVPDWFDWDAGLFRSRFFGTDGVREPQDVHVNVPDHLRCVNLCLMAHDITSCSRYLKLAALHGGRWADAIVADSALPVAVSRSGPVYALSKTSVSYRAAPNHASLATRLARRMSTAFNRTKKPVARGRLITVHPAEGMSEVDKAERFLASNGVVTFLRLWRLTGRPLFREAAERLIGTLVTQLGDADAGAVAHVVAAYREMTGDHRYDEHVLTEVDRLAPWSFTEISVDTSSPRYSRQPPGVGKRKDMLQWFEDGRPRRHNPVLLAVAARIRNDQELATRAVDLARTYFALATRVFPDGRDHGCAARSVSAVARGHGRDNDTGMVTAVLAPMLHRSSSRRSRSPEHRRASVR